MNLADRRLHSAATQRNRQPILDVLQRALPPQGLALEIAAGSGQHAVFFAANLPEWTWLPTDCDDAALESIAARRAESNLPNLLLPRRLDVLARDWPDVPTVHAIFCANLLHISPWTACQGLMSGAARHLMRGGLLLVYGPFIVDGQATAPSNLAFDAELRARNPAWGVRRLSAVAAEAAQEGLALIERVTMPANNLTLLFKRAGAARQAADSAH